MIDRHNEHINNYENKVSDIETNLAEKNRDLNQAFEKVERLNEAKDKLSNELANMKVIVDKKDNEIEW